MISNMLRFPLSMFDDDFERLFYPEVTRHPRNPRSTEAYYPPVNIGTTDTSVDVYLFAPGMDAEALDVVIEKNLLSVSGERKLPAVDNEKGSFYRQERFDGQFKRVITLPEDVNTEHVQANYKDGVLHISIAKREEVQPRQVKIAVQ